MVFSSRLFEKNRQRAPANHLTVDKLGTGALSAKAPHPV
jgi:hypothetical protein